MPSDIAAKCPERERLPRTEGHSEDNLNIFRVENLLDGILSELKQEAKRYQ